MKYSIPGLGGRLRRARRGISLSQKEVALRIGVSWMTVHRWERSQRGIPDEVLYQLSEIYDKPLRWFLTLEGGDLPYESEAYGKIPSEAADRLSRKIASVPADQRPMVEKFVEDILDGLTRVD